MSSDVTSHITSPHFEGPAPHNILLEKLPITRTCHTKLSPNCVAYFLSYNFKCGFYSAGISPLGNRYKSLKFEYNLRKYAPNIVSNFQITRPHGAKSKNGAPPMVRHNAPDLVSRRGYLTYYSRPFFRYIAITRERFDIFT